MLKLWKNNRLDAEWEMDEVAFISGYFASKFSDYEWPTDRAVRAYLTSGDDGCLSSVMDEEDIQRMVEEIIRREAAVARATRGT